MLQLALGCPAAKMADLISGGEVRVNWKEISQPSYALKDGDLVAIRGKGRLTVGEVVVTKKKSLPRPADAAKLNDI